MAMRIISNIPEAEVDAIIDLHEIAGATQIRKLHEPDGEFTVIAIYPDLERFSDIATRRAAAPAS